MRVQTRGYLQFGGNRPTPLHRAVNNLHSLEELVVMLLWRHDLNAERRIQIDPTVNRLFIPWSVLACKFSKIHVSTYRVSDSPYPNFPKQGHPFVGQSQGPTLQRL